MARLARQDGHDNFLSGTTWSNDLQGSSREELMLWMKMKMEEGGGEESGLEGEAADPSVELKKEKEKKERGHVDVMQKKKEEEAEWLPAMVVAESHMAAPRLCVCVSRRRRRLSWDMAMNVGATG